MRAARLNEVLAVAHRRLEKSSCWKRSAASMRAGMKPALPLMTSSRCGRGGELGAHEQRGAPARDKILTSERHPRLDAALSDAREAGVEPVFARRSQVIDGGQRLRHRAHSRCRDDRVVARCARRARNSPIPAAPS